MRDHSGRPLRTVWVIGAGFSKSLGGPLLPDLFKQQHSNDLHARYPSAQFGDLADLCWRAQILFNSGKDERQWVDAEQFIDFVDCAKAGSPEDSLLLRMSRQSRVVGGLLTNANFSDLAAIKSAVLRALAAECSWFSRGALVQTERWAPYRAWLRSLDGSFHKIVSFNYDEVLERLSDGATQRVLLPQEQRPNEALGILKLHGSVTWLRVAEGGCKRVEVATALATPGEQIALAVPGQTKRALKDELFDPLWRQAAFAIREAETIIFLGYRFPETDGDARRVLLHAIRSNNSARLRVHVVLGPNTNHADALRVRSLLEVSTRGRKSYVSALTAGTLIVDRTIEIAVEPLFAEDFLALYADEGPLSAYTL